jgi:hypothetical protein
LLLGGCAQLTPHGQMSLLQSTDVSEQYEFELLPSGMQGSPSLSDHVIDISGGKSFYKGYRLEDGHGAMVVQLRTYIVKSNQGEGFFYPVVELFDRNRKRIDIVRPQLRFTQISAEGRYAVVPLQLSPEIASFVIRTEPKLYGQEASYTKQHQGASWSYSVSPFTKRHAASYLALGRVELLTPDVGFTSPFEKLSGPFWSVSLQKGSKKLASGEDYLPDLTLGGGPNISFGYAFGIPGRPGASVRSSVGASYYAVKDSLGVAHTQQGFTGDVLWVESNQSSSLGFGITVNSGLSYKNGGDTLNFKDGWGPKLVLEIRGAMGVSLGVQASWLSFEDQYGNKTNSDQLGFYLARFY